jgi:hypothetical protein
MIEESIAESSKRFIEFGDKLDDLVVGYDLEKKDELLGFLEEAGKLKTEEIERLPKGEDSLNLENLFKVADSTDTFDLTTDQRIEVLEEIFEGRTGLSIWALNFNYRGIDHRNRGDFEGYLNNLGIGLGYLSKLHFIPEIVDQDSWLEDAVFMAEAFNSGGSLVQGYIKEIIGYEDNRNMDTLRKALIDRRVDI